MLVKGGHGEGDVLEDVLIDRDGGPHFYRHPRVRTSPRHGLSTRLGLRRAESGGDLYASGDRRRPLARAKFKRPRPRSKLVSSCYIKNSKFLEKGSEPPMAARQLTW